MLLGNTDKPKSVAASPKIGYSQVQDEVGSAVSEFDVCTTPSAGEIALRCLQWRLLSHYNKTTALDLQ